MKLSKLKNEIFFLRNLNSVLLGYSNVACLMISDSFFREIEIFTMSSIIDKFLKLECNNFIFIGEESEKMHDLADDFIFSNNKIDILTTWHNEESAEDIAEYFLGQAMIYKGAMVAILKKESIFDSLVEFEIGRKVCLYDDYVRMSHRSTS